MIPFAAKDAKGKALVGFALSDHDLLRIKNGEAVIGNLSSCDVGVWTKDEDGSRTFVQPRNSNVVFIAGDSVEEIGEFLNVDLK